MKHETTQETVLRPFIDAALFSSTDDDGDPLDANFSPASFTQEARAKMAGWVADFLADAEEIISETECARGNGEYSKWEQAGQDLWFTSARHGVGFWDGDWPEDAGRKLTALARKHVPEYGLCFMFSVTEENELSID